MAYQQIIEALTLEDERFVVMTAENRAVIRALPPLLKERFIDTGITEQTMIGMAAGLAKRGRIPICHALAPFLIMRAYEFIRTDVGIANLPVKLSGFIPGFLSDANGPTHQALEDVSLMRGIPNMEVFCPADEEDMDAMLKDIWSSDKPSYVRLVTKASGFIHTGFVRGKAEVIGMGKDVNILVSGFLFVEALETYKILKQEGYDVGLINVRSLKPIDEEVLVKLAQSGSILVTMEDHFLCGGLYSIVAEVLLKYKLTASVFPFAMKEKWFKPGLLEDVLEHEGFKAVQMAKSIIQNLKKEVSYAQ